MARRANKAGVDPLADLEKKAQILERELSQQREALERLKDLGKARPALRMPRDRSARKTA